MVTTSSDFHPLETTLTPPAQFTYPFYYTPHPLALLAAGEVQRELSAMVLTEGKMFGVLVAADADGRLGFLAAYSGLLMGRNDWPYFVPPVFDAQQPDGHFKQTERRISAINQQIREETAADVQPLKVLRRQLSEDLQTWLFRQYRMLNARGERRDLLQLWQEYHCSPRIRRKFPMPPGGTGDCCAPKLLQRAYASGLRPLCMAEFWWGPSPATDVRHHGRFYPACRGKCKPLLTWMLQGLDVETNPETLGFPRLDVGVVYEDDHLAVVSKPSGLLSVPGRAETWSVSTVVAQRWPGALLAHRLDMGTSGLMLVAKSPDVFRHLQRLFSERAVHKRYVALVSGVPRQPEGRIELPLRPDPINRPRQAVDRVAGKPAVTDYRVVATEGDVTRLALWPHTGRTHQLRLHCAHAEGLGCPIVGDELYGHTADRLYLHAEELSLVHPVTGSQLHFRLPAPF